MKTFYCCGMLFFLWSMTTDEHKIDLSYHKILFISFANIISAWVFSFSAVYSCKMSLIFTHELSEGGYCVGFTASASSPAALNGFNLWIITLIGLHWLSVLSCWSHWLAPLTDLEAWSTLWFLQSWLLLCWLDISELRGLHSWALKNSWKKSSVCKDRQWEKDKACVWVSFRADIRANKMMMMIRLTAKQLSWVGWHLRLNPLSRYYIWGRLCLVCDFMQVFVSHLPQWAWRRYEFDSQAGEGEKSTVWPVCVFTLGCQRWLMPCVLKVEAWRFSSVLTKPSSCAANCLSPCVRSVSVNEHEGCLHVRQGSAAPCCLPQHRRAVSCIAVTGHWAARLEHGSCPHRSSTTFDAHVQAIFTQISDFF